MEQRDKVADTLVAALKIDAAEIARRKAFLDFTEADIAHLVALHDRIEANGDCAFFVDAFYRHLLAFEETARLIKDEKILARLKETQTAYFHSLTAGDYGPPYVRDRLMIGAVHERVGLDPKWYLGAYCKYLSLILPRLREYFGHDPDKLQDTLSALHRIIFFDIGLAIDTYMHADQQTIRTKTDQLAALNRMAIAVTSSLDLKEVLDRIMRLGIGLTASKASCIAFYDRETQHFKEWVTQGLSEHFVNNMFFHPGGLADEAFTTTTTVGTYILSNDRPETQHKLSKLAHDEGLKSFICLPLTSHANRLGVIYFYRTDRDTFTPDEIELLTTCAHLAAEAIENARLYGQTKEQARTDVLTGLYNRREFGLRLAEEHARAVRYDKPYALMMLDLDHFKQVNDTYGHPAGDAVLKTLADILRKQLRDVDLAARYGGEEFVVVFPEISGGAAKLVAERVCHAVAATPFRSPDGREIGLTVSIGVSCYPDCAGSPQEVVDRADQALYVAKEAGRNRVVLYREMLKKQIDEDPSRIVALLNENLENIQPIAMAISAKAAFFRGHAHAAEQAARRLAQALELSATDAEMLRQACRLHDIGMAVIPDAVLSKTTKLTEEEWVQVRRHPAVAAGWLEQVPALKHLAPIVRHHHERLDGSGYPDGLKGEATPYLARVLAVADAYASMITEWPGHLAMKTDEVKVALRVAAGQQFDPNIVEVFLRALETEK